jgi:hypothetical protein
MQRGFRGIAFVVVLGACGSTPLYQVSSSEAKGVPFYVVEQYDVRTYVYEETFYALQVKGTFEPAPVTPPAGAPAATDSAPHAMAARVPAARTDAPRTTPAPAPAAPGANDGDKRPPIIRTVIAYARDTMVLRPYYIEFVHATNNVEAWKKTGLALLDASTDTANEATLRMEPFPSLTTPSAIVGYARFVSVERARIQLPSTQPRYFNVSVPRGGTSNAEIDLNGDGTLGKGIAQTQDQLPGAIATAAGTVASALVTGPLTTITGHYFGPPATAQGGGGDQVVGVDFAITPVRRVYSIKVTRRADAPAGACDPKTWDELARTFDSDAACRVELAVATQGGGDDKGGKKDDDKNNISINGSIALPAAAGHP